MRPSLAVVCFQWGEKYSRDHVLRLEAMVRRNLRIPHSFIAITDVARELLKLGRAWPKLWIFSPEGQALGERILLLDLDCVVTGDLTPLVDRPEDFLIWKDPSRSTPYNTSMVLMDSGARPQVWQRFNPKTSPAQVAGRFIGSDQAWVCHCLPDEKRWTEEDGVLSFKKHVLPLNGGLPENARIVFFHGRQYDPSAPSVQERFPWVKEGWAA